MAGAGEEARLVETLFWVFLVGATVIWTAVMVVAVIAFRCQEELAGKRSLRTIILWSGAVLPTIVVAALLVVGLLTLRSMASTDPGLTIQVDGEQWWWRVVYETSGGEVVTANTIRLPQGQTAEFLLTSDDVIHSLWAPALGGKMDLIPGRINRLKLTPLLIGSWGGFCAEYCGGAHAQMRFDVVVMEPETFDAWLAAEAKPASPEAVAQEEGLGVFLDQGCGACHTVRGTQAAGPVGPDLTHLAGRGRIGAGLLPLTEANLRRWITHADEIKLGVKMPPYPDLSGDDLDQLTRFLMALE